MLTQKGLDVSDFKDRDEAFEAADAIIANYKAAFPDKEVEHPDIIFPNMKQLDQFWFGEYKGIQKFRGPWARCLQLCMHRLTFAMPTFRLPDNVSLGMLPLECKC